MTNFEIEITYNMICRPGQVVRIHTKETTSGRNFIMTWKKWTVIKRYKHHVLMRCRGYRESFTNTDIKEMIRKEDIK
jgi:hypothetical protein